MTTMQRSLSLPGPGHTTPPVSPTVTHISSRTPTPSPPEKQRVPRRLHRYQSRSPQRSTAPHNSTSNTDTSRKERRYHSPSPYDRTSDDIGHQRDLKEQVGSSAANAKPKHLSLLHDVSQYINTDMFEATVSSHTTLEELAHLVRLSTYQERKRIQFRVRLQRSLVSTALSARLARCGEHAYRTLVDNFRADDKRAFAILYNAVHDVRTSCDLTRRYALLEPDLDHGRHVSSDERPTQTPANFMLDISQTSRDTFLHFLTQIRTNPDYLASRISSLTTTELQALSSFHQGAEAVNSVLPFHTKSKGFSSNFHRSSANIPTAVERLLSFQRHDPLSALIHTCFANSAGPDSLEDLRRTDVWATTCARMITQSKTGSDPFICSVLNVWTAMRDWSGRTNMEWYLMKILEDGAFLLETAEDEAGTRIRVEPRNTKDAIAAEEFYTAAVEGLFDVIDDPGAGGMPEGLLELGNAILRKLDPSKHVATRKFLVSKWLFTVFLCNVVIHPESFGMMAEYHITEYGRQKILKEVVMRAQRLAVDMTWNKTASIPIPVRTHMENILARFRVSRSTRIRTKLLPARSITSLRETVEVHPYLVLAPSDLITLVNALFPERRPSSSLGRDNSIRGLRSSASSISGLSSLVGSFQNNARTAFDNESVISVAESVTSDVTTSREPLLDDGNSTHRHPSGSFSFGPPEERLSYYDDESYDLRLATTELSQILGFDAVSGNCHPCAERWTVLFMSPDGQRLSTQMLHDPDDELEDDEFTTSSEDDDQNSTLRPDLDKGYQQLRTSILKLVEDYEIPQTLESEAETKTFSNRMSNMESPRKKSKRVRPTMASKTQSRNPYRMNLEQSSNESVTDQLAMRSNEGIETRESARSVEVDQPSVLISMLESAEAQCQAQSDFVNAHLYWKTLNQLHQLSSTSLKRDGFASLLSIFSRGPRDSIRRSVAAVEEYEAWSVWLKQSQERHDVGTEAMMKRLKGLRDKMWYVTDVKNSAAYEGARNVAVALKRMATAKKTTNVPPAGFRPRTISRPAPNNFLVRTEAQFVDMIAAADDQGGPNKLSDEQSEKTLRWLNQFGVENFCKGEERIHRFCLEIEACINKLVGEGVMDGPVLWASELYTRDQKILDRGRHGHDFITNGIGSLSISRDEHDTKQSHRGLRSTDFSRASGTGSLRSMSARNSSQQSFDSSRFSVSRTSGNGDIMDSQDYFGMSSPVLTLDTAATFWSPFQRRASSSAASISSQRPGTSSSTNETVLGKEDRLGQEKQRFLSDLKQTLTSLLISDLGTLVFSRGSETDSWFSGELGQDCIERKERTERKLRRKFKRRTLEKKKSHRDLRSSAQKPDIYVDRLAALGENMERSGSNSTKSTERPDSTATSVPGHLPPLESTASQKVSMKEPESLDFPYRKAFHRLLRMFSVHPNPYTKLNALFELEHLIIAFLTPSKPQRLRIRQESLSATVPVAPAPRFNAFGNDENAHTVARANNLEEAIDNCKERRAHTLTTEPPSPTTHRTSERSQPATTDMIVDVLQDLFRDADMCPKTLFRDLQFIAAFVPASILDKTERGKAFWDAGLAALGLKQDVCRTIVEIADEVVVYYTQTRKTSSIPADPTNPSTPSLEHMKYSMQDAGKMWAITAREGDPVAERELAIFYLTHPELVERVTAPLSKPRETFKAQVMEMYGNGSGGRGGDRDRSDPATMCVAYHWMELSATGGDELAKKYLRQREELNALP